MLSRSPGSDPYVNVGGLSGASSGSPTALGTVSNLYVGTGPARGGLWRPGCQVRIRSSRETVAIETAVEIRTAPDARVTYTSYWRATIKTLAATGSEAPRRAAEVQRGFTSKITAVVSRRAAGWTKSFRAVM